MVALCTLHWSTLALATKASSHTSEVFPSSIFSYILFYLHIRVFACKPNLPTLDVYLRWTHFPYPILVCYDNLHSMLLLLDGVFWLHDWLDLLMFWTFHYVSYIFALYALSLYGYLYFCLHICSLKVHISIVLMFFFPALILFSLIADIWIFVIFKIHLFFGDL